MTLIDPAGVCGCHTGSAGGLNSWLSMHRMDAAQLLHESRP